MKTILVTGAAGQLGTEIRLLSRHRGGDLRRWIFTDIAPSEGILPLDILDKKACKDLCISEKVECIINCAAYNKVDAAETDIDRCRQLNAEAPGKLARIASKLDIPLIHISSDYVFDGLKRIDPYFENSKCQPLSVYGRSKRDGELAVIRSRARGAIIRTSWLYSPFGENFVKTMLRLGAERETISVVADQRGNPTAAIDLADAILRIITRLNNAPAQIYHYSNEGVCSWYELASLAIHYAGLPCQVLPITSAEYPTAAQRPVCTNLDKGKIKVAFRVEVPFWAASLKRCIERIKAAEKGL